MSVSDKGGSAVTAARRRMAAASFYLLNPNAKKSLYSGAAGAENTVKVAGLLVQPCCPVAVAAGLTVTYNGSLETGGTVPVDPLLYQAGAVVTVLGNTGNLTRDDGRVFLGWVDSNGVPCNTTFIITTNTTLYAYWDYV